MVTLIGMSYCHANTTAQTENTVHPPQLSQVHVTGSEPRATDCQSQKRPRQALMVPTGDTAGIWQFMRNGSLWGRTVLSFAQDIHHPWPWAPVGNTRSPCEKQSFQDTHTLLTLILPWRPFLSWSASGRTTVIPQRGATWGLTESIQVHRRPNGSHPPSPCLSKNHQK